MKVRIKEPCTENWNEMTPQEQGRHCAKCDKVVQDFTQMRNDQIFESIQSEEQSCGRFFNWQLNKDIQLPTLQNPWTSWVKKVAFSGFLFGSAVHSKGQDAIEPDTVISQTLHQPSDSIGSDSSRTISGFVHQPSDTALVAKQVRFNIGDFDMIVDLDSQVFSLDLPVAEKSKILTATIITDTDSFTTESLELSQSDYLSLYYDSTWKMESIWIADLDTNACKASDSNYSIETVTITTISGNITLGGFGIINEPNVNPLPPFATPLQQAPIIKIDNRSGLDGNIEKKSAVLKPANKASKDLIVYNKRKSSVWWWLLPIPLLLFFAGYYRKKKQALLEV